MCVRTERGERRREGREEEGGERGGLQLEIMQEPACPLAECTLTN